MFTRHNQEYYNELYLDRQQKHFEFRHTYSPKQEKFLLWGNLVIMIYGFVYMMLVQREYGKPVYAGLGVLAALQFATLLLEKYVFRCKTEKAHENFYECFSVISALLYVGWGLLVVWASIAAGRNANYLPVLIVYAVCSMFMYFSIHHYIAVFLLTWVGSKIVMPLCGDYAFDRSIYANVVITGVILTVGGISKYTVSINRFLASIQANKLREALQVNNDELKTTAEKLRKSNEAQRLFTASMSHELRSPLNGVIGLLQVLEDDKTIEGESHENISKALSSSKTLIAIVNDLLDYYKLEAGEFNIVEGVYDVRELTEIVQGTFAGLAEEKGIKLIVEAREDMPCILRCDGVRIQQVIFNIVSNAVKYTSKGEVRVNFDYCDGCFKATVADTGMGIKKEYIPMLFDPFKRLEEHRTNAIQGTGLGLSIVKQLVEQMHGTLNVDSEYGKGTTFSVAIPVKVSKSGVKYSDIRENKEKKSSNADFSGRKFLCVDDNKVNLSVFKGLFKGTNAETVMVDSGAKCLEKVVADKYDVIFIDHMMPGMDGLETFRRMKEMEHLNQGTPIVMLTANAGLEAEMLYTDIGFDGYLSKPLLKDNLYDITNKLLTCRIEK